MLIPTIIMGAIAIVLLIYGYYRGEGEHISGIKSAFSMIIEIIPLLIFAFIIAGMAQILIPKESLSRWVGTESGIRGIIVGTIAGGLTPGGPFVSLPVAAGLLRSGAAIGTIVAYITGWAIISIPRLPLEVGILGWRFTLIRIVSTFFFPVIAGILAKIFFDQNT